MSGRRRGGGASSDVQQGGVSVIVRLELQPLRPAAGVVMDAEDLQCSALKAIGNYDRCVRHDQLARTRDAAGMAKLGIFGEIASDTIEDAFDDALRGVRIIPCDVLA